MIRLLDWATNLYLKNLFIRLQELRYGLEFSKVLSKGDLMKAWTGVKDLLIYGGGFKIEQRVFDSL